MPDQYGRPTPWEQNAPSFMTQRPVQQPQGQPWYLDAYNGLRDMFGLQSYQPMQNQQTQQPLQPAVNNNAGDPNISAPLPGSYSQNANIYNYTNPSTGQVSPMSAPQSKVFANMLGTYDAPRTQGMGDYTFGTQAPAAQPSSNIFQSGISRLRDLGSSLKQSWNNWRNR
jgi:hypothetical protein